MVVKFKNNASGYINGAINNVATTITLQSGDGDNFPALAATEYFYATLVDTANNYEIVKVTVRSTDTLTVIRAQEGTTARSFPSGSRIELRVTAQSIIDAIQNIAVAQRLQNFIGTGAQQNFTLTHEPPSPQLPLVVVNGLILKYTDDYTISGTTLSFVTAPALNDEIIVRWFYVDTNPLTASYVFVVGRG